VFGPILLLLALGVMYITDTGLFAPKIETAQPIAQNNGTPATVQPNAQPSNGDSNSPVAPVLPGSNPAVPVVTNGYASLCQPGDARTPLTVAFDSYPGFYPLVYRIMALNASEAYCINLMPKWSGPNYDQNGYSEAEMEDLVRSGQVDVYFASNGALALYDAGSGRVIWTTDQSAGADAIVAWNDIAADGVPSFNDALGQTVLVSKASADHYYMLKAFQAAGFQPGDVYIEFSDQPVADFLSNKGKIVAYWDPPIRDAMVAGTKVLTSTNDWRTISDYIVVSLNAYDNKEDALVYFLADYNAATEAFTVDNLEDTANVLVNFEFAGNPMADWLWMDVSDSYGSLETLMSGVAIATFNDNFTMFENIDGWSLVKDQLDKTHGTWVYGEIYDNTNNTEGTVYNSDLFISNKFVELLAGSIKSVRGEFSKDFVTDVNENLPKVDKDSLFVLPELLTLQYKNIKFVEGQSKQLVDGEETKLLALVQPIANLMAESPDSVIVLQGGHGLYSPDQSVMDSQAKFAYRRAQYIRELLSEKLNIPINRIIIDPHAIAPTGPISEEKEVEYKVVLIKVVNAGEVK
ncbi:hypothetical protein KBC79_06835, partial [Candidatus Woesebacteria bacterium]|nr:hypothetical protein [Candidatus Woesebacteria bacterium]